jgi:hypothetical protein
MGAADPVGQVRPGAAGARDQRWSEIASRPGARLEPTLPDDTFLHLFRVRKLRIVREHGGCPDDGH